MSPRKHLEIVLSALPSVGLQQGKQQLSKLAHVYGTNRKMFMNAIGRSCHRMRYAAALRLQLFQTLQTCEMRAISNTATLQYNTMKLPHRTAFKICGPFYRWFSNICGSRCTVKHIKIFWRTPCTKLKIYQYILNYE
jgi:hypothetical protein